MSTIDTDTQARLSAIRTQGKPSTEDAAWRNGQIARLVHAGVDKNLLSHIVGMGVPQINRIARTTPDGPSPRTGEEIAFTPGAKHVPKPARKPRAPKAEPKAKPERVSTDGAHPTVVINIDGQGGDLADTTIVATVGAFDKAPALGHVPPRVRRIRSTGSEIAFGHANEMGYDVPVGAKDWVSRCVTHGVDAHFETRGEARYQDGTGYCLDCASEAGA